MALKRAGGGCEPAGAFVRFHPGAAREERDGRGPIAPFSKEPVMGLNQGGTAK